MSGKLSKIKNACSLFMKNFAYNFKHDKKKAFSDLFKFLVLIVLTALIFFFNIADNFVIIIYLIILGVILIFNIANIAATWFLYLIAAIVGIVVVKVLTFLICTGVLALQKKLIENLFGDAPLEDVDLS